MGNPTEPNAKLSDTGAHRSVPRMVIALGFVSLCMDTSSEIAHGLLPAFLVMVHGETGFSIGIIEGVAEGTTATARVFSGALSDWLGKRKLLVLIGYGLAALAKPLFPLAAGVGTVFVARFVDRIAGSTMV
jgi:MFS family permease